MFGLIFVRYREEDVFDIYLFIPIEEQNSPRGLSGEELKRGSKVLMLCRGEFLGRGVGDEGEGEGIESELWKDGVEEIIVMYWAL